MKPVPRAVGAKVSKYQVFVKENFGRVKKEMGKGTHGEVMEVLGREYRESKATGSSGSDKQELDFESIVKEMEVISLDD
jgi:hypothetical protein